VTRRVLAAIPPSSQVLCASPYLDANLFQYDEKHISPTIRPRALAEARSCAISIPLSCTLQLILAARPLCKVSRGGQTTALVSQVGLVSFAGAAEVFDAGTA
jgi:De-etiolated protein 1 Det1